MHSQLFNITELAIYNNWRPRTNSRRPRMPFGRQIELSCVRSTGIRSAGIRASNYIAVSFSVAELAVQSDWRTRTNSGRFRMIVCWTIIESADSRCTGSRLIRPRSKEEVIFDSVFLGFTVCLLCISFLILGRYHQQLLLVTIHKGRPVYK